MTDDRLRCRPLCVQLIDLLVMPWGSSSWTAHLYVTQYKQLTAVNSIHTVAFKNLVLSSGGRAPSLVMGSRSSDRLLELVCRRVEFALDNLRKPLPDESLLYAPATPWSRLDTTLAFITNLETVCRDRGRLMLECQKGHLTKEWFVLSLPPLNY
ncbi:hypothetical protein JOB18_009143 [Solea senegalensis]|uniref:Uncharacterized protein n=1 Tax=Solea senegalensis TaxID=28829 RepID=A0AAV6QK85_SOLSE|nr:hypothetical protein JOB18_009143 [Solea senegalensis]